MRSFGLKLFLCAVLTPAVVFAQGFEANRDEGLRALKEGDYARAETLLAAAHADAASFPPTDARLIPVLEGLATARLRQQKYAEAEPLYARSLAIQEQTLGADQTEGAATLDLYAALLRLTSRPDEAALLEARLLLHPRA